MPELLKRTVFGALYLVVMVVGLVLYPTLFPALCVIVAGGAMGEFYTMALGPDHYRFERFMAVLTTVSLFTFLFFASLGVLGYKWAALSLLPFVLMVTGPIFRADHSDVGNMGYIVAGMAYVGIPVALVPFFVCRGGEYDGMLLLDLFILIWISDIGAYVVGTLLGQKPGSKKLCPAISPKKSWWGFAGAVVLGAGAAVGLYALGWLQFRLVHCIALGVIMSVGSVLGDLVESMWKRFFGVKDSGKAIPGHGGLYDRFDSSLVAIPLAAVYIALISFNA